MKEQLLNPREVFDKIDSINMCKTSFIEWCKEAGREAVEALLTMIEMKHSALTQHAKTLEQNNASEEDIESVLYELMYFMHMYQTANQALELHHPLS